MKLNWRDILLFSAALICATSALVAAGLAEAAADQPLAGASASRVQR